MNICLNYEKCGFVRKYSECKSLAVKGFVKMYCFTDKQNACKRKIYKEMNGIAPSDDMMPNGQIIKLTNIV